MTVDVKGWVTTRHTLVRRPNCPACGTPFGPDGRAATPLVLESRRKKTFTQDGGHRAYSPEQTLAKYEHHVSPILGAVNRLERDSLAGRIRRAFTSTTPARITPTNHIQDFAAVRRDMRSQSGGKGASDIQAKAGALCEALERRSGVFRGDEPRRKSKLADLGGAGIHPNDVHALQRGAVREPRGLERQRVAFQRRPRAVRCRGGRRVVAGLVALAAGSSATCRRAFATSITRRPRKRERPRLFQRQRRR